jgi:hypothetical protein
MEIRFDQQEIKYSDGIKWGIISPKNVDVLSLPRSGLVLLSEIFDS